VGQWQLDDLQVVLASGKVVNANITNNSDLFRVLKGGANNFGIVTSFDFQTFAQGEILAGFITSPLSQLDTGFDAFAGLANSSDYDLYAKIVTAMSYTIGTG
jgi:FAD/FMN-containing dehydrogenase